MRKKLMVACLAIASIAAFAAAPASASPVLTENGIAIATGSTIVGTNSGEAVFSGSGLTVECSKGKLTGKITENSGTSIKTEVPAGSASFKGTESGEDCKSNLGSASVTVNSALCFATVKGTDNVSITGCGSNVTFTLTITGTGTCRYTAASFTSIFITNGDSTLKVSAQSANTEPVSSFFCPSSGNLTWHFIWGTSTGTTLLVS